MKNHLRAGYCNQCGAKLEDGRAPKDADGRAKLYADIAHPINSDCREMIQERVIHEYFDEIELAKQPGYVSRYDDFDFEYAEAPRPKTGPLRSAARPTSARLVAASAAECVRPRSRPNRARRTARSDAPHVRQRKPIAARHRQERRLRRRNFSGTVAARRCFDARTFAQRSRS